MREVLEHIQRFCTQMQMSDLKSDNIMSNSNSSSFRLEEAMEMNKRMFDDDDDDDSPLSSDDGMTPPSDDDIGKSNYGGSTMRSCSKIRDKVDNGGGDAK